MRPWFITTTVSASAIASGCVWVTWTKVMPSLLCRRLQLAAHPEPQELVERRQRLVEEQHARIGDQRAGERDALLLAAGELRRHAVGEGGHVHHASSISATRGVALLLAVAAHLQIEGDVVADGEMREERVALEHQRRAALHRRLARPPSGRR